MFSKEGVPFLNSAFLEIWTMVAPWPRSPPPSLTQERERASESSDLLGDRKAAAVCGGVF